MKTFGGQEVQFHAHLALAPGEGDIRKRGTGPSTDWTGGWVGQRGSFEAIDIRKFSLSIKQPFTLPLL